MFDQLQHTQMIGLFWQPLVIQQLPSVHRAFFGRATRDFGTDCNLHRFRARADTAPAHYRKRFRLAPACQVYRRPASARWLCSGSHK